MPDMLSVEAYVAEVLAALAPLPAADTPLAAAHGLVLAQDVAAALPVPPWTNSAMDGYLSAREPAYLDSSPQVHTSRDDLLWGSLYYRKYI